MAFQVIVRKKAEKQLDSFTVFTERNFGNRVATKFYNNIISEIRLLADNPQLGPIEPLLKERTRTYRSLLLHKHFKLIYYISSSKETLYIVALWDIRREPDRLAGSVR